MTVLWDNLMDAVRTAMSAVWTEVVPNGIWDAREALGRSFEKQLTPPYAIIDLADLPASGAYGVANRAHEKALTLYYIGEKPGDSSGVMQRLLALNDYLDTHPLSVGQLVPINLTPAVGRDLEPNALLILLNATQQAGALKGTVVAGTSSLKTPAFAWAPH